MPSRPAIKEDLSEWDDISNRFIAELRGRQVGARAPQLGEIFPDFTLPNSRGAHIPLSQLIETGPVVISFMRGQWCPYCKAELQGWHDAIPRLEAQGGRFVGISAEVGGRAEDFRCHIAPNATMLCDVDHGLALSLGLAFPVSAEFHQRYVEAGIDLAETFGNSGRILPVTATYVIDHDSTVRYAFVDPDFRIRADPTEVIAAVEAIDR